MKYNEIRKQLLRDKIHLNILRDTMTIYEMFSGYSSNNNHIYLYNIDAL